MSSNTSSTSSSSSTDASKKATAPDDTTNTTTTNASKTETSKSTTDTAKKTNPDASKTSAANATSGTLPSANTSITDDIKNTLNFILSTSNIILVLWFLAAYFIAYSAFGIFQSANTGPEYMLKIVDILIIIAIFAYLISYYYYNPKSGETVKKNAYDTLNNVNTLLYTGLFLIAYALIVIVFRIPVSGPSAPISLWMLSTFATIIFTITAIVSFCKYFLGISILDTDTLSSVWGEKPTPDTTNNTSNKKSIVSNEVFNVSNNLYTYDDARAVCSAFGARLATYDEIEEAYNKGGEWCNYGWSEGQMAFFPTQKSTWDELQKNPKSKNNCGRPGVNGGYIENPYIKFGVNCFGKKPDPTDKDIQEMKANKLLPKTAEDELMDKKVKFWKENADKLLNLNSFNRNNWSEY